ncbi:MAG: flagellar biosynthesis anti-sigma factor FlgM [Planctomycetota bacterium]
MQIYGPNQAHGPQSLSGPHFRKNTATGPAPTQQADQVDISPAAAEAAQLAEAAEARAAEKASQPIRTDLVNQLRTQIAGGTYDTAERMDAALDRLLDELG